MKGSKSSLPVLESLCSKVKENLPTGPVALGSEDLSGGHKLDSVGVSIIGCCFYVLSKLESFPVGLVMCYFSVSQIRLIGKIICVAY